MTAPEPDLFREAMSHFASGVTVVTTQQGGVDHAMTASAFTSVSLDPPLVLVCVDKTTRFHQAVALSRYWGASVLAGSQLTEARWLATRGRPRRPARRDPAPARGAPPVRPCSTTLCVGSSAARGRCTTGATTPSSSVRW